jgi:hypothetical protein
MTAIRIIGSHCIYIKIIQHAEFSFSQVILMAFFYNITYNSMLLGAIRLLLICIFKYKSEHNLFLGSLIKKFCRI